MPTERGPPNKYLRSGRGIGYVPMTKGIRAWKPKNIPVWARGDRRGQPRPPYKRRALPKRRGKAWSRRVVITAFDEPNTPRGVAAALTSPRTFVEVERIT